MRTLYLPTSSLNFNNILSTESISPAGVYARRGFGYKRFEKVLPNPLDNSLLLYSKAPAFEINDAERDNFPIVLALKISDKSQFQLIRESNGIEVFRTFATLYLTPPCVEVLFRDESEMKKTLVASTRSLETKLVDLYERSGCFSVQSDVPSFAWLDYDQSAIPDVDEVQLRECVRRDQRIDRVKGFLYAYLLGSFRSLPRDVVILNHFARRIRNTVSSIVSGGNEAPPAQWNSLLDAILGFDQVFSRCDGATKAAYSQFPLKNQKNGVDGFLEDVRQVTSAEGCHHFINRVKAERNLYYVGGVYALLRKSVGSATSAQIKDSLSQMEKCVAAITQQAQGSNRVNLSAGNAAGLFAGADMKLTTLPGAHCVTSIDAPTIIALIDELTHSKYSVNDLASSRLAIAKDCGLTVKGMVDDGNWQGSPTEKYINGLLKNVGRGDAFDVSSTESLYLRSLAAFILKGDELEKLEDFLVSNAIGEFCLAYGFFGAFAGFAALPRSITDTFYKMDDLPYLNEVYWGIHTALYGEMPSGELCRKSPVDKKTEQVAPPQAPALQSEYAMSAILEFEEVCRKGGVARKRLDCFRKDILPGILNAGDRTEEFAAWVKDAKKVPKHAVAGLMTHLYKLRQSDHSGKVDSQRVGGSPVIPPAKVPSVNSIKAKLFIDDNTCAKDMLAADAEMDGIPVDVRKDLSKKLTLFQKDYGPDGYYTSEPKKYLRDNANTIDHFCRCLSSDKTKKLNVTLSAQQKATILTWLKDRFGVR